MKKSGGCSKGKKHVENWREEREDSEIKFYSKTVPPTIKGELKSKEKGKITHSVYFLKKNVLFTYIE